MLPYIILFFVLFFAVLSEAININESSRKKMAIVIVMFCVFFCGFRYYTGSDWAMYMEAYEKMPIIGNFHHWEMGFVWLSLFFHWMGVDYHFMQAFVSLFLFVSLYRMYKKHSEYPLFLFSSFVVLFFLEICMAQVRQSIAVGILAFSLTYVLNKSFWKFFVVVFLAMQFHVSAVMFIPVYFLRFNFGRSFLVSLLILCQIIIFYPKILLTPINLLMPILPDRLADITSDYLSSNIFGVQKKAEVGFYFFVNIFLTILSVLLFSGKDEKKNLFVNCLVVSTLIKVMSTSIGVMSRFTPYYMLFGLFSYVFFIDIHIGNVSKRIRSLLFLMLFFLFLSYPFKNQLSSRRIEPLTHRPENYRLVPYYNYFFHPATADQRKDWDEK